MKNKYLTYLEKLKRFNRWEIDQIKSMDLQEKLNRYTALFSLQDLLSADAREKGHIRHIQALSRIQQDLRNKKSKNNSQ